LISACYLFGSSERNFDKETILFDNGNAKFDWLLLMSEQSIQLTMTAILRQSFIEFKIFPLSVSRDWWTMTNLSEAFLPYVPYIALATRVWLGGNMMIHGCPKIRNSKKTAQEMKLAVGIPPIATYVATILEIFGGIFLIIGLFVPLIGLFFVIFMTGNIIMKKTKTKATYIAQLINPSYEIDITYLILSISLVVLGAGALSIDSFIDLP
jgi:putative oxidoreductase